MLRRFGIDGFEKGSASFQGKLAARGTTPDAFAASLSGSGKFSVSGLRASLLEDLAHTLTFFGASRIASGGIKVAAPFAVKNGIADFAGITASSSVISANGSLVLNFVKSSIDSLLRFHIGGLEIPLKISGPFGRISVGLDAGDARP